MVQPLLFVDGHNTRLAPVAAALLTHHATGRVVTRAATVVPKAQVTPVVPEGLDPHGILPDAIATATPLTDDLLRAADWVITLGTGEAVEA